MELSIEYIMLFVWAFMCLVILRKKSSLVELIVFAILIMYIGFYMFEELTIFAYTIFIMSSILFSLVGISKAVMRAL